MTATNSDHQQSDHQPRFREHTLARILFYAEIAPPI
jgi:hypothetical protein